jgi:lipopolysaccharide/colanic/teichoic acid biosynthesis glycosyltransferase
MRPRSGSADVGLTILLAPMLFPLMLLIALCIKIDSPGPVFFVQERLGFRGETFRMIKFRTMFENHEGPNHTAPSDRRVTRVRRVLRYRRLDELPQVYNVLKGEMSWIGPRPESLELAQRYQRDVAFYLYRHIVRPGTSGWAQVNQGQTKGVEEANEKLQYDFYYIKHFSPWLDLLILFKTARTLITGFGAR